MHAFLTEISGLTILLILRIVRGKKSRDHPVVGGVSLQQHLLLKLNDCILNLMHLHYQDKPGLLPNVIHS